MYLSAIEDHGKLRYVPEILLEYDCANHLIYLPQESYLEQFLECFEMANAHLVSIPLAISASLTAYANIQFAASQIGGNPSIPHLQAAKPILFYLKGALSLRLALGL